MARKYSDEEKEKLRAEYERSRIGDLTSYAALLGDSFSSKVNLLSQILRDVHEPSIGRYKERLLTELLAQFIPKRFSVGTGFVAFPSRREPHPSFQDRSGYMWRDHTISRQCDVIVYDSSEYPTIFSDGEFVVVRPESVRSIIEVKGALDPESVNNSMDNFLDFAAKWKQSTSLYTPGYSPDLIIPKLYLIAWQIAVDRSGRPKIDGKRLRERIARICREKIPEEDINNTPIIDAAYIYNDCVVSSTDWYEARSDGTSYQAYGFETRRGKLVRVGENGDLIEAGDGTIAELLAGIQYSLATPFNSYFAHVDQSQLLDDFRHPCTGFSPWIEYGSSTETDTGDGHAGE